MRQIPLYPLAKGKHVLVDNCDYDYLMKWKWFAKTDKKTKMVYAIRNPKMVDYVKIFPKGESGRMHLLIARRMSLPIGKRIDHKDQDGLNNRRQNLRLADKSENGANRGPQLNNTSGYKGVHWYKRDSNWCAKICVNGRRIHLGYFDDVVEAAKAYNKAAKEYFGEFAHLNKV